MDDGFVLDTSAYIGILNGDHQVSAYVATAESILVPSIVIGELFYGYHKGNRYFENTQILLRFLESPRVAIIPIDNKVAKRYGQLRHDQYKSGQILADNDLWIAAVCIHVSLPLLTFDSDFSRISDDTFMLVPV